MKRWLKISLLVLVCLIIILFIVRLVNPREIDDVTPGISCSELGVYNPDILWVIPDFQGNKISENRQWCDEILSLNKTLGLHGIKHTYREFQRENISQEDLEIGISEFEECFGSRPEMFKFPQLRYNKQNRELLKENNLTIRSKFSQFTHKVYHCDNGGIPPEEYKIIDLFKGIMDNRIAKVL